MLDDPKMMYCVLRSTQTLFSICPPNCAGIIPSYLHAITNVMVMKISFLWTEYTTTNSFPKMYKTESTR